MGLQDGAVYVIRNVKADTVVDLDFEKDGQTIHGWEYHWDGKNNQRWRAFDRGDGWVFQSLENGHFLGLEPGHNLADGLSVAAIEFDQTRWDVKQEDFELEHGEDVYRLLVKDSWFCLDLADHGNPANGTQITLWGAWKGTNQIWRLQQVE